MKRVSNHKEVNKIIKKYGKLLGLKTTRNKKHASLRCGKHRLTFSCTPSDGNSHKQLERDILKTFGTLLYVK
ncbi:hypothetical protein [Helicobacter cetorum]|uniref:YcfA family protein n=1 Tax=Helicobacter cetorum (strain ATCC BAA-429 / MIT 00-7128) TaxID=182217 RepID=I0EKH9_HELC0|nr:hypothetical protein [Helicobacter cetorum]AFI03448.1 hypothetical protein HCW_00775 [Helicobacter cetorum MIT 00-7128]